MGEWKGIAEMEKLVLPIAELIKDPYLIFSLCIFAILCWVIYRLLNTIKDQVIYERELVSELNENSQTLVKLTTLIESLVHGRGGR